MTNRIAILFWAATGIALAQQQPAFEVASIKLHKVEPGPFRVSTGVEIGRIVYTNVTLKNCIRQAYGLKTYQVPGGPAWANDERYDIVAKAVGPARKPELMRMLQTLLADRFQLRVHFETKEMPVYSLVVAKNGPKLQPAKDKKSGTEIGGDAAHPFTGRNVSMSELAATLARLPEVDRPVTNATGVEGTYDLTLDYVADDSAAGPSIFTALQEQLGLKLEPTRGPVQILVIDRAEKPTQN